MPERWRFEVMCCFCGERVEQEYPDPCTVVVSTPREGDSEWQQFYCHTDCFRERLVDAARSELRF
jgi:hypothetical protein